MPPPGAKGRNHHVVKRASAISIGTERSVVEIGRCSIVGKLKARLDPLKGATEKGRSGIRQ